MALFVVSETLKLNASQRDLLDQIVRDAEDDENENDAAPKESGLSHTDASEKNASNNETGPPPKRNKIDKSKSARERTTMASSENYVSCLRFRTDVFICFYLSVKSVLHMLDIFLCLEPDYLSQIL